MKAGTLILGVVGAGALIAVTQFGCGKTGPDPIVEEPEPQQSVVNNDPTDTPNTEVQPEATPELDRQVPFKGEARIGGQCPTGFNVSPVLVPLELWDCPLRIKPVELTEPLTPLLFSADCNRKVLTIRTQERSIDTNWEFLPDGSFFITLEGLNAKLKDDGEGNKDCTTSLTADIWGKVECGTGRDPKHIKFETTLWLNKPALSSPVPAPSPSISASASPSTSPHPSGTPSPTQTPSPFPSPTISMTPLPSPSPSVIPNPTPRPTLTTLPHLRAPGLFAFLQPSSAQKCKVPEGKCYLHAIHQIQPCT
ncbi:hypothetical protein WDW37_03155 [Bdellovibrionota bacterium FG-1]